MVRDDVPACVNTIDKQIVELIKVFMQRGVTEHGSRTTTELREVKDTILTACLANKNISKRQVRERLGVSPWTITKTDTTSDRVIYSYT